MMTFDLAGGGDGDPSVVATALHPSTYMPTKIVHSPVSTIADGVRATSRLVWQLPPDHVDGQYFNVERPARAHAQAYDLESRARLRHLSEELTKTGRHQSRRTTTSRWVCSGDCRPIQLAPARPAVGPAGT